MKDAETVKETENDGQQQINRWRKIEKDGKVQIKRQRKMEKDRERWKTTDK